MATKLVAFCWRSGKIEFDRRCPEGALPIARDFSKRLRDAVEVVAVRGYDGQTLLVPGLPTAATEEEAFQHAVSFRGLVQERLN